MNKLINIIGISIVVSLGLYASYTLDTVNKEDHGIRVANSISDKLIDRDTITFVPQFIKRIGSENDSILKVEYLFRVDDFDYTREYFKDRTEVIAIGLEVYPRWKLADSVEGINSRGSVKWMKLAGGI